MNISDVDGNGYYDVNDFLKMKNEEILKENGNKRWDVCLMNPPYSEKKNGDEFYKKFIYKVVKISNNSIIVHPSGIFDASSNSKKEKDIYLNRYVEVDYIDGNQFDAGIRGDIIISSFLDKNETKIIVNKHNKTKEYQKLEEIRFENSDYLYEFENKIKLFLEKHPDTLGEHIHFGPKYSGFTRRDLILNKPPKDKLYVFIYKPNAAFNGLLYTSIHKDNPVEYEEKYIYKSSSCFVLFNEDKNKEAQNFIKYTKGDFIILCCMVAKYIIPKKIKYLNVPWLDFSKEWTDKELFEMIGMEYNKEEIDKLLNEK